ncbi:LysR family transcriptional regulator [Klebsiella michiganensis]|uniref:LysR family transcriptional regulator n=1 Tax=Klebsiella michiganensis TaxID=1134687 RepID=UPI00288D1FE2|nr:LysR family transcriptional regulator [Klebsiella michiganensis]
MDTLVSMRVFREVVELNSFNAAAKKIAISTGMVSKHITYLESMLQTRLLNRTSRNISLTETGELYYASCQEALDILDNAETILGQHNNKPHGTLRVTAPQFFSAQYFSRIIMDYQYTYPNIRLELYLENQTMDLVSGQYDLALRVTSKLSPTMIARPLLSVEYLMVGSPSYFAIHGYPSDIQDLKSHNLILPATTNINNIGFKSGKNLININPVKTIRTNDTSLILQLTRCGFGIAYLPQFLIESDLKNNTLQVIKDNFTEPKTLYAVYKNRQFLAPKVRSFIDFLVCELKK